MVMQNLLINSVHAMEIGRGRIRIAVKTRGVTTGAGSQSPTAGRKRRDIREKIFIPFFTTNRGTGLGLPTAKRFIDAHHGRITIELSAIRHR